ncbi:hypothetical protein E1J38_002310 [Seonamhaeicola sediminis]|uniref:DNA-directed RNA polymerase n=1 Tax=Seonamhaeicola sediminis TaxID=2528206 RepID=A0A562YI19_9FLAO|nr:hypothetical protein [Seonamhaeicola sediminis]TWO34712.1 hypothetical protein E1J38_002310 [Seonamhaeicola sediminis]
MIVNINDKEIHVWLSKGMMTDLKEKLEVYNKTILCRKKLSLPVASYFANLPTYIHSKRKDEYHNGWVPICSDLIKPIGQNEKYMDFLVDFKFFEENPSYSPDLHYCKQYRLTEKYRKQVAQRFTIPANKDFCKKRAEFYLKRMENAKESTGHLTNWLDKSDLFEIDVQSAENYIKKAYTGSKIEERNCRQMIIDKINDNNMIYSREGKDNRLHSLLTSISRDLRPFIKYNDKPLISLDITSSQPFILASIIYRLINHQANASHLLEKSPSFSSSIMFNPNDNARGLEGFINKVLSGEFYSSFGDVLYKSGLLYSNVDDIYLLEKGSTKGFESRRDAAKKAIMRILYSSSGNNEKIVQVFNETYPEVGEILKKLKSKDKSKFPILMQNIEAAFVLDYCTKEIALKHPEIPLFTTHDSILTTEDYVEILEEEFYVCLKNFFVICPRLKKEFWSGEFKNNELKKTA